MGAPKATLNIFPQEKILNTVCLVGVIEIIYSVFQLFGIVPDNYQYAYFSGSLNNPAVFGMFMSCCNLICVYYSVNPHCRGVFAQMLKLC